MSDSHTCGLCSEEFSGLKAKITHNCPEKPEEVCEKKSCAREQKDGSEYCPAHSQQVWIQDEPEKEVEEREVSIFRVQLHYTAEVVAKVKAWNKHEAFEKVREDPELEPEITDEVHKTAREVGTTTEIEEHGYKEQPPTYLRLDTMEAESVEDREEKEVDA